MAEQAGDQASLETRARWEGHGAGRAFPPGQVPGQGMGAAPGSLWRVNQLVKVTDSLLGLSGDYLIEKLEYLLAEDGGGVTNISVVHPDALCGGAGERQGRADPGPD